MVHPLVRLAVRELEHESEPGDQELLENLLNHCHNGGNVPRQLHNDVLEWLTNRRPVVLNTVALVCRAQKQQARLGLHSPQFAKELGVPVDEIHRWESGRGLPSGPTLLQLGKWV